MLTLNKDKSKEVYIQCEYCDYSQYSSIHNYLGQLNLINKSIKILNNYCKEHLLIYSYYYVQWKNHICKQYSNHHTNHIIPFDYIVNQYDW